MDFHQRIAIQDFLAGIEMANIAEINPGKTSQLDGLTRHNETYAMEMQAATLQAISRYPDKSNKSHLPASFDLIFSCGVFEKLSRDEIALALQLCNDHLRAGGIMVHALPFYIASSPTPFWLERFNAFRDSFQLGGIEPVGEVAGPELIFSPDMASTSDSALFDLYKASPHMAELRMQAQHVCLIYAARRIS
ncbi:MAG: class I SAM-dependent methyltransferase [Aquisalinus sp.]|nr:class I SAM-dependent methyltransferase [Aquisalinus sp.]